MLKQLLLSATLGLCVTSTMANTMAYNRAMVLGRAHGAAMACGANEAERKQYVDLAFADIGAKAANDSDRKDAEMRFGLETAKARRSIEGGSVDCGKALWFYQDQLKGLQGKRR